MKIPWYVVFMVGLTAGFVIFWKGCEKEECDKIEIVNGEVYPERPRVEIKQPDVKPPISVEPVNQILYVKSEAILQEKYDSLVIAYNELSNYRRYADSIEFDNLTVFYHGETLGYLTDIDIGIIDNRPTLTRTITITPPKEIKHTKGLYVGFMIGGNKESFSTLTPAVSYINRKHSFDAGYNLMDGSIVVGVKRKVF